MGMGRTFDCNKPGPGTTIGAVAEIAGLAGFTEADADLVWVQTLKCLWHRDRDSTLAPDGITVVAATGGGNWERQVASTSFDWLAQAAWGIDPAAGDDENAGTPAEPLETAAELERRLSVGTLRQATTVTTPAGSLVDEIDLEVDPGAFTFEVLGTPTVVYSGTVDTFVDRVHATPESALLTDLGVADWTPYLNLRLRITSGAALGAISFVAAANPHALGLDVARVGRFVPPAIGTAIATPVVPAAGSAYVIETLPVVQRLSLRARGQSLSGGNFAEAIGIRNLLARSPTNVPVLSVDVRAPRGVVVDGCWIDGQAVLPTDGNIQHHLIARCLLGGQTTTVNLFFQGGGAYLNGCVSKTTVAISSGFTARVRNHLHHGGTSFLNQATAHDLDSKIYLQDVQVFDCTARALRMQNGCVWNTRDGLSGDGNTIGLDIGDDDNEAIAPQYFTWCKTVDVPNLQGTTSDVRVNAVTGDTLLSWATIVAEGGFSSDHQHGSATLANGTCAVTARNADVRPPQVTLDTPISGGAPIGILSVPTATKTAAQFVVNAVSPASGGLVASDQSSFVWEIPPMRRQIVICQANAQT